MGERANEDEHGLVYCGVPDIARRTRFDPRLVERCRKQLLDLGELIAVSPGGGRGRPNLYLIRAGRSDAELAPILAAQTPVQIPRYKGNGRQAETPVQTPVQTPVSASAKNADKPLPASDLPISVFLQPEPEPEGNPPLPPSRGGSFGCGATREGKKTQRQLDREQRKRDEQAERARRDAAYRQAQVRTERQVAQTALRQRETAWATTYVDAASDRPELLAEIAKQLQSLPGGIAAEFRRQPTWGQFSGAAAVDVLRERGVVFQDVNERSLAEAVA